MQSDPNQCPQGAEKSSSLGDLQTLNKKGGGFWFGLGFGLGCLFVFHSGSLGSFSGSIF